MLAFFFFNFRKLIFIRKKQKMGLGGAIAGTVVFFIIALVGCCGMGAYVTSQTIGPRQTKMENREYKIRLISLFF